MKRYIIGMDVSFNNTAIILYDSKRRKAIKAAYIGTSKIKKMDSVLNTDVHKLKYIVNKSMQSLNSFLKITKDDYIVAIELPYAASKSSRAGRCMGMITALYVTLFCCGKIQYYITNPLTVKKYLTGDKYASKELVKDEVIRKCDITYYYLSKITSYKFEHIADAIASAIWYDEKINKVD